MHAAYGSRVAPLVPHLVHCGGLVLVYAIQVLRVGQAAAASVAASQGVVVRRARPPLADEAIFPASCAANVSISAGLGWVLAGGKTLPDEVK